MADKIIIEGNAVTLVSESVKSCGTLDDFITELTKLSSYSLDGIPRGCLAVEIRQSDATYFVHVPAHMRNVRFQNSTGGITRYDIFIPHSLWAIQLQNMENGSYGPLNIYWHFLDREPIGRIIGSIVYQNFMPNVHAISNNVCLGTLGQDGTGRANNVDESVNSIISSVENSAFNTHLMEGYSDKYSRDLITKIEASLNKDTKTLKDRIDQIGKELLDLEASDWERLTDKEINALAKKRTDLVKEREAKITELNKPKTFSWVPEFFPFLADWAVKNSAKIANDPSGASADILQNVFKYSKKGTLKKSGDRSL